jgi:cytochrome P450
MAFLFPGKELTDSVNTCRKFIDRYVGKAMAEGKTKEGSYVFMHEMIDSGASPEYVRDQLMSMILAGRDTTASVLTALFWTLARRPEVVAKLKAEIATQLGTAAPTWEQMKDMTYLNWVLKEGKCFPLGGLGL